MSFPALQIIGEPVLSFECKFSDAELRDRMEKEISPEDANEYLARVRLQDRNIPKVVIAVNLQEDHLTQRKNKRKSHQKWVPPEKIPKIESVSKERREALYEHFIYMRDYLRHWEDKFIVSEKHRQKLMKVEFPDSLERIQWIEFCMKVPPLLHVLMQMDNVTVVRCLKHFAKAIDLDKEINHQKSAWIFALLARLEIPYTDDVASSLKSLLRETSRISTYDDISKRNKNDDEEMFPKQVVCCLLEDFYKLADDDY